MFELTFQDLTLRWFSSFNYVLEHGSRDKENRTNAHCRSNALLPFRKRPGEHLHEARLIDSFSLWLILEPRELTEVFDSFRFLVPASPQGVNKHVRLKSRRAAWIGFKPPKALPCLDPNTHKEPIKRQITHTNKNKYIHISWKKN